MIWTWKKILYAIFLIVAFLLYPLRACAAIVVEDFVANNVASGASVNCTFTVAAGNTVFVVARMNGLDTVSSVSDGTNTYTERTSDADGNNVGIHTFNAVAAASGSITITVTRVQTSGQLHCVAVELSGVSGTNGTAGHAASAAGVTTINIPNTTTSVANAILISAVALSSAWTPGATPTGYTLITTTTRTGVAYRTVSASGTYGGATWTDSGGLNRWAVTHEAFAATGAAATPKSGMTLMGVGN